MHGVVRNRSRVTIDAALLHIDGEKLVREGAERASGVGSGMIAMAKKDWATAKKIFDSLLRRHAIDRRAQLWSNMLEFAERELAGK